ncbi:MAG: DNA mismatch repair protein MutS [Clostridia bacterium]|nr:DNA mismatch repair protein MutS [Clostridia bacterium]
MMQQYFDIKKQYPDCILFFRLGDFYEMFYDDAKLVSSELELILTGKDCGQEERAPMCGVPFHSYETYAARLIANGHKVAICEQMEDPALAKGLVKREVIRILTPATVIEGSMLDEEKNNYLSTVYLNDGGNEAGLCFVDSSTGTVELTRLEGKDVVSRVTNELGRFSPKEVLLSDMAARRPELCSFVRDRLEVAPETMAAEYFDYSAAEQRITSHFGKDLDALGLSAMPVSVRALGCALEYLYATQMTGLERIDTLHIYFEKQYMHLDLTARRNLELTETMRSKSKRGSLLGVLDHTRTAMGKRLIRSWIEQPLIQPAPVISRQNAVDELLRQTVLRGDITEQLDGVYDLERIMTRIVYGSVNAKELRAMAQTLSRLPAIHTCLTGCASRMLQELCTSMDLLEDICQLIDAAIVDDPPFSVREGGMIRAGYNEELDLLRGDMTDGKGIISRIEQQEKEKTGIKNLKVGYNRVFGYYIEISKSYTGEVPDGYVRKQTLANAERYITQELKELEARVLGAQDRSVALEYQLFTDIRTRIAAQLPRIQATALALAQLDVLCSFAQAAALHHYTCPQIRVDGAIRIKGGRHPVVEALSTVPFVANDTYMDDGDNRVLILTGPNMAGKSTYMRQTALIVLMAQIGSFVPAQSAEIGMVDSIFTRVGASDDLSSGQSTFMVEMSEVAEILHHATSRSLIIFDEIGRGTSTFDGMSIARAVLEHVANPRQLGAKTLFATHYHELTCIEQELPGVKNYNVTVKKRGDDITFLRRIVPGPADDSYGIEVAKLAGVPDSIVARAKEVLREIESGDEVYQKRPMPQPPQQDDGQLILQDMQQNEWADRLRSIDVETLTPIEAMQVLYELVQQAKQS